METIRYTDLDGKTYEQKIAGEKSALPYIQKRFERLIPVETISTDDLRATIQSIAVDVQRNLTPAEVQQAVDAIKNFMLQEIDNAEKYYVDRKGGKKNG